jgi:hypothetical protein
MVRVLMFRIHSRVEFEWARRREEQARKQATGNVSSRAGAAGVEEAASKILSKDFITLFYTRAPVGCFSSVYHPLNICINKQFKEYYLTFEIISFVVRHGSRE